MIPKDSTPIKNKILIDIIAKGLLSKDEMRIIAYIIRWSWGFNGIGRRQDWTKKLTKRRIADGIDMHESHLNRNINRMIKENIIIVKNGCYQFNEHFEEWKNLPKRQGFFNKNLTKKASNTYQNGKANLPNKQIKLTKKASLAVSKPLNDKPLLDRKDNKDTYKKTLKGNNFLNKKLNKKEIKKNKENITKSKKHFLDIVKGKGKNV